MAQPGYDIEKENKNSIANADNLNSNAQGLQPPPLQFNKDKKQSGNPGEFLGYFPEEIDGESRMIAKFKALPNTWVSESAKSIGLDNTYAKNDAYGAYVLEDERFYKEDGSQMFYPDDLQIGEQFSIVIERQSIQPEEEYKFCPVLDENKEEPTPTTYIRDNLDWLSPDMLSIALTGHFGGGGVIGTLGLEVLGGVGGSANLIVDVTSPDFGKVSFNPHAQVSGSGKLGAKGEASPKGGFSLGISSSEYTGDPNNALLKNITGFSAEVSAALEAQALAEFEGGVGVGVSLPDKTGNVWESMGGEGGLYLSGGAGFAGDFAGTVKYTDEGEIVDPMPEYARTKHQQFIKWLNSK